MTIWGRRDSEPAAEEAHENQAGAHDTQEPAAETQAEAHDPVVTDADEPAVTGAGQPAVAEADEPVVTDTREPAVLAADEAAVTPAVPVVASSADAGAAPASTGGIPTQHWSEILVAFVDDPRGSVQMAADAVDAAIGEFVTSVRARQRDLASTWQGAEVGTEHLRTALLEYRKLGRQVQQLDLGERDGA